MTCQQLETHMNPQRVGRATGNTPRSCAGALNTVIYCGLRLRPPLEASVAALDFDGEDGIASAQHYPVGSRCFMIRTCTAMVEA